MNAVKSWTVYTDYCFWKNRFVEKFNNCQDFNSLMLYLNSFLSYIVNVSGISIV